MRYGSSPRMWGLRAPAYQGQPQGRFIPTYVGFTCSSRFSPGFWPVHPHVCGVYPPPAAAGGVHFGSSPRMWGLRPGKLICQRVHRFIPTYVGFTHPGSTARPRSAVHPHVCGVYLRITKEDTSNTGSSPRMWGLPPVMARFWPRMRFIPTYVGFTTRRVWRQRIFSGSSPRMWGLRRILKDTGCLWSGSSPRMWGLQLRPGQSGPGARFIPTYVGFTYGYNSTRPSTPVHPHVCGVYPRNFA